jgi:hypothetical protein
MIMASIEVVDCIAEASFALDLNRDFQTNLEREYFLDSKPYAW